MTGSIDDAITLHKIIEDVTATVYQLYTSMDCSDKEMQMFACGMLTVLLPQNDVPEYLYSTVIDSVVSKVLALKKRKTNGG